jgi:hypothetical protein
MSAHPKGRHSPSIESRPEKSAGPKPRPSTPRVPPFSRVGPPQRTSSPPVTIASPVTVSNTFGESGGPLSVRHPPFDGYGPRSLQPSRAVSGSGCPSIEGASAAASDLAAGSRGSELPASCPRKPSFSLAFTSMVRDRGSGGPEVEPLPLSLAGRVSGFPEN